MAKAGGSAMTSAINPKSTITIYADDSTCTDGAAVVAEGEAAELEGFGIELTTPVKTDSITALYANQRDLSGTSGCSAPFDYRQVTGPPEPPSLAFVSPVSPANDNNPYVGGATEAESTVSLYSNPSCSGAPIASGTSDEFSEAGIQVSVPDNFTTTFYATAAWASFVSACSSSSVTYQELSPPPGEEPPPSGEKPPTPPAEGPAASPGEGALPAPNLRTVPATRANNNSPLVVGTAPSAATVRIYENAKCDGGFVAKGTAAQLGDGFPVQVADNTVTHFYGVAFNGEGKPSTCSSAPVVYTEDSTPPLTRITLGPGVKTRARAPVFRFTDTTEEIGTSFLCKVDSGKWKACQTPWRVPRLRRRSHMVRIKAIDAAGNAEMAGAKRRFKVIARPHR